MIGDYPQGPPGSRLELYEIQEVIAATGNSRAFRVIEKETNTIFALKWVTCSDRTILSKLANEAKLLQNLDHPNIVRFHDSFLLGETEFCLVTEYAALGDLGRFLRSTKVSPTDAFNFFAQIVFGLGYLHERNVMHRDIKPANVFVFPNLLLKLGDFGISKQMEGSATGTWIGTPLYMAPEIDDGSYSFPADIWAAGCVLYEIMNGGIPRFQGCTKNQIRAAVHLAGYSHPFPEDAPAFLRGLVCRMLDPAPSQRPTARDLLAMDALFEYGDQTSPYLRSGAMTTSMPGLSRVAVPIGPVQADLSARHRRLEEEAVRILGEQKYRVALAFIKENCTERRDELPRLLSLPSLPSDLLRLLDAIVTLDRFKEN
jgi:serine/threonine protein kinase